MRNIKYQEGNHHDLRIRTRQKFSPYSEARAKYPENQWLIEAWSPDAKPWLRIQDLAYQAGLINDGMIGKAKCMLFKVKPVIELYRMALVNRPFELYGLEKPV